MAELLACAIGRRCSKVVSQVRQRNSYKGILPSVEQIGGWLTNYVSPRFSTPLQTRPAQAVPETELIPQTGEPIVAHIVKTEPGESAAAKVLEARVYGTPLEAVCGHVWVPSRDPKQLPMCQKCKDIYDTYRMFNEHLGDSPS